MQAKVEIRTIKPAEAGALLENMIEGQRSIRETHIHRLAEDMRLGRYRLSPDAITICMGKLANGQHRLTAVMRSGLPQKFVVMQTDDPALYEVLDCGKGRTVGDVLSIQNGHPVIHNRNCVAAVARMIIQYDKQVITMSGGSAAISKIGRLDVIDFVRANQDELQDVVDFAFPLYKKTRLLNVTVAGSILIIGGRVDPVRTRAFVQSIYTGETPGSAAWLLRERMIKDVAAKSKLPSSYKLALGLKALRAFLDGAKLGVLKIASGEEFPRL